MLFDYFLICPFSQWLVALFLGCFGVSFRERKEQFEHPLIHRTNMRQSIDLNTISQLRIIECIITSINTENSTTYIRRHIQQTINEQEFQQGVDFGYS